AYSFLKLGFLTERADITSRVVDVAAAAIVARSDASEPFLPLLWTYVLKTLSANNAYRREIGPTVSADDVVNFVFKNERFPRSAAYCFNEIRGEAANLKNNSGVNRILDKFDRLLDKFDAEKLSYMQLHNFINEFQELLFTLNKATSDAWFTPKS
ncbi:MAG: alpha-E domain-containing protein, partial [bacterium]